MECLALYHGEIWRTWRVLSTIPCQNLENMESAKHYTMVKFGEHGECLALYRAEIREHGECLALYRGEIGEHGECLALYQRDVWGILSQDSCACLGIWASPRSHCCPLMTHGTIAHACLGAKSRTWLLLDVANENMIGRWR